MAQDLSYEASLRDSPPSMIDERNPMSKRPTARGLHPISRKDTPTEEIKGKWLWLGIAFAMNALTCIHWFVLTLIPLGLSGAFLLTRYRIWRERDLWLRGATCLAVAGLVLLPFLLPYQRVSHMYGIIRTSSESVRFSARVGNWLTADPANKPAR